MPEGSGAAGPLAVRTYTGGMDADLLASLRALVDQHRLRIVGRLATTPADPETLARELRLPIHLVRKQLQVLAHAGLVEPRGDRPGALGVRMDRVGQLGRALAVMEREATGTPRRSGRRLAARRRTSRRHARAASRHAGGGTNPARIPR